MKFLEEIKQKKAIVLLVAVVVIGISILWVRYADTSELDRTVQIYTKAQMGEGDAKGLMRILPEEYIAYIREKGDISSAELAEQIQENIIDDSKEKSVEYFGKVYSWKFEILNKENGTKQRVEKVNRILHEDYNFKSKKAVKKIMQVKIKVECNGIEYSDTAQQTVEFLKIKGKWCLSPMEFEKIK